MVRDKSGRMLAHVRADCRTCNGCDSLGIEIALNVFAQSRSLATLQAAPVKGKARAYSVEVNAAVDIRFVWNPPFADDLELICRG
jgi:hypothetical protein